MNSNYRIVVLECPYDHWNDPFTREMFGKMAQLKLNGYRQSYPYGILPLDTSDFVATHLMICEEKKGELEPVLAYRSLPLERTKTHLISFPPLALMRMINAKEHEQAIEGILSECNDKKLKLSYESSFTIVPELRGDETLWNLLRMLHVKHHSEGGIDRCVAGGSMRFKVGRVYYFYGYKDLSINGKPLDPVKVPFAFDELVGFYYREAFSQEALLHAEKWVHAWEARVQIGGKPAQILPFRKAA